MAKLTYNEAIFTNVHKYDETSYSYTGLQIASKLNQKNGQGYKLIDAIDIDWDGAWLETAQTYINTSEDLITAINDIADLSELQWVKDKINELDDTVENILSTYVTKSELEEILGHYQKPITGGEHITINEDNEVSTYGLLTPEEASDIYTTLEEFGVFSNYIYENYYNKAETTEVAIQRATEAINAIVIKNADDRYSDLEKISDWILSQSSFIPVDYDSIITDGSIKYYIYDSENDKYILVDNEYISSHPDEQYYIEKENNIDTIRERVDRLDEVIGFKIYDENLERYTYTEGLLNDVNDLSIKTDNLITNVNRIDTELAVTQTMARESYYTANTAYELAYAAYESSIGSDILAKEAYTMAYTATEKIGIPHSYAYFSYLTEEDIALLEQDPNAIQVYSIKEDNHSGVPLPDVYVTNSEYQYYKYTEEVLATGFYKDIEETRDIANDAKTSADNALFRLHSAVIGTENINLEITPAVNSGNNSRTIVLDVDEAEINSYSGEIIKDGLITTFSLSDTLSYISSFVVIEKTQSDGQEP